MASRSSAAFDPEAEGEARQPLACVHSGVARGADELAPGVAGLESAHGRSDPADDFVEGSAEAHRGLKLPAAPEVLFELSNRVEVLALEAAGGAG